jgi:hypothetical protein
MPGDGLPIEERRLALATKRTIQAAGGLKVCEAETRLSDTHLSRFCSTEQRDSISIRDAVRLDALGNEEGAPHILGAMASILGYVVIPLPEPVTDDRCLQGGVMELAIELGDLSRTISHALCGSSEGGPAVTPREAEGGLADVAALERVTARVRVILENLARGQEAAAPS